MKLLILAVLVLLTGCLGTTKTEEETGSARSENLRIVELEISGMSCPSCASAAEYKLKQKAGIAEAKVSYRDGKGEVIYDASRISRGEIIMEKEAK